MPRLKQKGLLIVAAAALVLSPFQNCGRMLDGFHGTETGNAMRIGPTDGTPNLSPPTFALGLVARFCASVGKCQASLDQANCEGSLASANGLAWSFGVATSEGAMTMNQLATAEAQGTIAAAPAAVASCENEMDALACTVIPTLSSSSSSNELTSVASGVISGIPACSVLYR